MATAPFIWPISSRAARAILKERRISMETFLQAGQLALDINTKLTKIGRNKWSIVDFYDAQGSNLKPYLTPEQQQHLPAFEQSAAAATFSQNDSDRAEAERRHRNLCEFRRI